MTDRPKKPGSRSATTSARSRSKNHESQPTKSPKAVYKQHFAKVCDLVSETTKLGNDLSTASLLSPMAIENVLTNSSLNRYDKVSRFMNEIYRSLSVDDNSETIVLLCRVLKKQDSKALDKIADSMLKELGLESYSSCEEESESMPRRKKSKRTADSNDELIHVSERERKRKRDHPKRKSKQPSPVPTESESEDESTDEPDYDGSLKRKRGVKNKKGKQMPTSESQADSSEEEYESAEERQHKTGTKNKKQSKRKGHCTPKSQLKVSKQKSSDNPGKGFLSGKDMPEVVKSLGSFPRYYQLGIQLEIDSDELKQIETNFPRDCKRCQEETIDLWINSGEATWGKLVGALKTVGNARLANEIEAKHISKAKT